MKLVRVNGFRFSHSDFIITSQTWSKVRGCWGTIWKDLLEQDWLSTFQPHRFKLAFNEFFGRLHIDHLVDFFNLVLNFVLMHVAYKILSHTLDTGHYLAKIKLLFGLLNEKVFRQSIINDVIRVCRSRLWCWVQVMHRLTKVMILLILHLDLRGRFSNLFLPLGFLIFTVLINKSFSRSIVVRVLFIPSVSAI